MQHVASSGLILAIIGIAALAIALGFIIAAPIVAVPFFIVGFGAFLLWRGKRRADVTLRDRHRDRVPATEETAGDPVRDSGVAAATASRSDSTRRADVPHA